MAYTQAHIVLQWGGSLYGSEIWVNTARLAFPTVALNEEALILNYANSGLASGVHALLKTWFSATTLWSTAVNFMWSKTNAVDKDGHYLDKDNANRVDEAGAGVAGTGTPVLPSQVSMAATWTTGATRGLAHAGRIYLPMLSSTPVAGTGLIPAGTITTINNRVKALGDVLNGLTAEPTLGVPKLSIMSKVRGGETHKVLGVKTGLVYDTQRRRRSSLIENWSAVTAIVP